MDDHNRIINLPQQPFGISEDFTPPYRETCTGDKKCILCKLTGYHNHTPQGKTALMKQAALGFLVIIILVFILIAAVFMALRMVGI